LPILIPSIVSIAGSGQRSDDEDHSGVVDDQPESIRSFRNPMQKIHSMKRDVAASADNQFRFADQIPVNLAPSIGMARRLPTRTLVFLSPTIGERLESANRGTAGLPKGSGNWPR
jgi:hypothetical protein